MSRSYRIFVRVLSCNVKMSKIPLQKQAAFSMVSCITSAQILSPLSYRSLYMNQVPKKLYFCQWLFKTKKLSRKPVLWSVTLYLQILVSPLVSSNSSNNKNVLSMQFDCSNRTRCMINLIKLIIGNMVYIVENIMILWLKIHTCTSSNT